MTDRRAFTLIELTVVLLILAIIGGAVAFQVRGPLLRSQRRDAVGLVTQYIFTTRHAARTQDASLQLALDLDQGRLARLDPAGRDLGSRRLSLPDACRLNAVLLQGRRWSVGSVNIPCSRQGFMPSFALQLTSNSRSQWLVFSGLTSEVAQVTSEQEAKQILLPALSGLDAR